MKKIMAASLSMIVILFVSMTGYSSEIVQNNFRLSRSSSFSLAKAAEGFSLKESYKNAIEEIDFPSFETVALGVMQTSTESIEEQIKQLKKKKTSSLVFAVGTAGIGAFLVYSFVTHKEKERETQEGTGETGMISGMRVIKLGGGLGCFAVTVALINDMNKKKKAIKELERELQALAQSQR